MVLLKKEQEITIFILPAIIFLVVIVFVVVVVVDVVLDTEAVAVASTFGVVAIVVFAVGGA